MTYETDSLTYPASLASFPVAMPCYQPLPLPSPVEPETTGDGYRALIGQTRSLVTLSAEQFPMIEQLRVAARHHVTVLLIGETGSGKTHLARLIHELSPRREAKFCPVACGALPSDLIESELFGHVKGAFTGADRTHEGKFAAAGAGTLLLDEIDVLPVEHQAKLLRVIETGEYEPVGSNDTRRTDARLIVASNRPLEQLTQAGAFRLDLYYRLNVLQFPLPPLRQRKADIPYLVRQFALAHGRTHGVEIRDVQPEFFAALAQHDWPGNIRELENVVRRAVLYCRQGLLTAADLPPDFGAARPGAKETTAAATPGAACEDAAGTLDEQMAPYERRVIEQSLARHRGHRGETARQLGVSRVTLYNKMRRLGLLQGPGECSTNI